MTGGWIALVRALGESLLAVLRAELAALQADLNRSTRQLGVALFFFGAVAALAFWLVGLLVFLLVALVAIWLPLAGAAGSVLAFLAVVCGVLFLLGRSRLNRMENPLDSARRRFDDHLDWWQNRLLAADTEEEDEL